MSDVQWENAEIPTLSIGDGKDDVKAIVGTYEGTEDLTIKGRPTKRHFFALKEPISGARSVAVWGSGMLNNTIPKYAIGTLMNVTYKGTMPSSKGNDMKVFDIKVARGSKLAPKASPESEQELPF